MARSTSAAARSRWACSGSASVSRMSRPGALAPSRAMAAGTKVAHAEGNAARRTRPARRSLKALRSARAARSRAVNASECAARDRPASVRVTPRELRMTSRQPVSRSRSFTCWATAGWVQPSALAAAARDPCRATSAKTSSWRGSSRSLSSSTPATQAQLWSVGDNVELPQGPGAAQTEGMPLHAAATDASELDGWSRLAAAQAEFDPEVIYLNTASLGLPPRRCLEALRTALDQWRAGTASPPDYDAPIAAARASYAQLVGVDPSRVAVGSQVSAFAGLIAAALPAGSQVLTVAGEFTSIMFPFLAQAHRGVVVRQVPLERLVESISPQTTLVAVSAVQSADGRLVDLDALARACAATGARVLLDTTQAVGWPVMPVASTSHRRGIPGLRRRPRWISSLRSGRSHSMPTHLAWPTGSGQQPACLRGTPRS